MDATLDAAAINREPASAERTSQLVTALNVMVDRQVDTLAAHDRLVARGEQLRLSAEIVAELRVGRAALAAQLQHVLAEIARLSVVDY